MQQMDSVVRACHEHPDAFPKSKADFWHASTSSRWAAWSGHAMSTMVLFPKDSDQARRILAMLAHAADGQHGQGMP